MKTLFAGASLVLLASIAACSPAADRGAGPQPEAVPAAAAPAAAAPVAISVPAGDYAADPNHSSITFKVQHLGLGYYAMRFGTFDATVTLDPANISASKVVASVKPSDIVVGYPDDYVKNHPGTKFKSWEDDLANSTRFLNAGAFPEISFVSTATEASGERNAKVTGDLTLLGVTKPVTLDVIFTGETTSHAFTNGPAVGFSATGQFKRSDFNVASHLPPEVVGDEISVVIEGDFLQKTAS